MSEKSGKLFFLRVFFSVDIHEAGEGDLGVIIMCDGETVQSAVTQGQDGLLYVSFEVKKSKPHKVYATYNQEPVPSEWVEYEPHHEKKCSLHMGKQRRRSAAFVFAT